MSSYSALNHTIEAAHGRNMGLATTLALGAAVVASELIVPRLQRPEKDVRIIGGGAKIYSFAGLTHRDAVFLAPHIEPALGEVDYIHYASDNGVKPAAIAKELGERFTETNADSIAVIGHSMGLLTGMLALQLCVQQGVRVPRIDTIWGLGSPRDHQDIQHWSSYQHIPKFTDVFNGFLTQYAGNMITNVATAPHKKQRLRHVAVTGFTNRRAAQNPTQWGRVLDLPKREGGRLDLSILASAGVLGPDTEVRLAYDGGDTVVFPVQALGRWVKEFEAVGCKVKTAMSESDAHIDLNALPHDFWISENKRIVSVIG